MRLKMSYATESHYKTEGSNKTECQIRLKVLREVEPLFLYFTEFELAIKNSRNCKAGLKLE